AVYKDQLAEIESELARGGLSADDADAARIEVSRRLLAASRQNGALAPSDGPHADHRQFVTRLAFVACALAIPAAAIGLYLSLGAPGASDVPRSARLAIPPDRLPVAELVARVEARLEEEPGDGRGWDLIAPIYLRQSRFPDAQRAYANAIRIQGQTPERLFGFANASVGAEGGRVSDDAFEIFARLSAANPERPQPRFWHAVGLEQRGRADEARTAFAQIVANHPSGSQVVRAAQTRLAKLGPAKTPAQSLIAKEDAKQSPPQPADGASGRDQDAMIVAMVTGLDARLREEGGTVEEWQRLIRSYVVLGRQEDALGALKRASKALAATPDAVQQLARFAETLGLSQTSKD
ncbi:MAG: c-type cytochrome biogenesis protein CcmI, partial [Pseudomonadota bacterium]